MRVLHVIPSVSELRGGPTFVLEKMASALTTAGISVDVACTNDNGHDLMDVPLGVPVQRGEARYFFFQRNTEFYTVSSHLLAWLWRNVSKYDVVHAHALFTFPTVAAAVSAARNRIPYVVRPVGTLNRWGFENRRPMLKRLSFRVIERKILSKAAAIHLTSEQERREVLARYPAAANTSVIPDFIREKTIVIPEPTELEENVRTEAGAIQHLQENVGQRKMILFLSRIDKKKGLELLIDAFARVHGDFPDTVLVIAGAGETSYSDSLRARVRRAGIADAVIWAGFVNGAAKWDLLKAAAMFVLPSYSENFAVAALEAMSCGTPAILSENVAVAEDIAPHGAALIVESNVESVERSIRRLLAHPEFAAKLGQNGRDAVNRVFSQQSCTEKLISMYSSVVESPQLQRKSSFR